MRTSDGTAEEDSARTLSARRAKISTYHGDRVGVCIFIGEQELRQIDPKSAFEFEYTIQTRGGKLLVSIVEADTQ